MGARGEADGGQEGQQVLVGLWLAEPRRVGSSPACPGVQGLAQREVTRPLAFPSRALWETPGSKGLEGLGLPHCPKAEACWERMQC